MSDTIIRKSIFGGFNRNDVLSKIEDLQQKLKNSDEINESYNSEISRLKKIESENELLIKKINDLTLEKENLVKKCADSELKFEQKDVEYNTLKTEYEKLLEDNNLKTDKLSHCSISSNDLIKNAMSYSDKIIESAKEDANNIYSNVKNDLRTAKSGINEINNKVKYVEDNLNNSVNNLNSCIESLLFDIEKMEISLMVDENE